MKKTMLHFSLPLSILREGKKYVAYTPALDLSTSGKTFDEAKKRFDEAVQVFFEEIVRKNTLEDVLRESGWRKVHARWNPPVVVSSESQAVSVSV